MDNRLTSGPLLPPQMCLCGSQQMPLLDTMFDALGHGRVYLCPHCVRSAALAHGYVDGDAWLEQVEHIARLREHVAFLEGELEAARSPEGRLVSLPELAAYLGERPAAKRAPSKEPAAA